MCATAGPAENDRSLAERYPSFSSLAEDQNDLRGILGAAPACSFPPSRNPTGVRRQSLAQSAALDQGGSPELVLGRLFYPQHRGSVTHAASPIGRDFGG